MAVFQSCAEMSKHMTDEEADQTAAPERTANQAFTEAIHAWEAAWPGWLLHPGQCR
jgi:hypothetical protein